MGTKSKNGPPFFTETLLVINQPMKFIVDTGSPVTLIPKVTFNNITVTRRKTIETLYEETTGVKHMNKLNQSNGGSDTEKAALKSKFNN